MLGKTDDVSTNWGAVFLPWGMLFWENHFRAYSSPNCKFGPWQGVLVRFTWTVGVLMFSMFYQANLKV